MASGILKLLKRGIILLARFVLIWRSLEIERANAVGARVQHEGQLFEFDILRRVALQTRQPVDDDTAPPCVGRTVPQATSHVEWKLGKDRSLFQIELGRVNGDGRLSLEIGAAIGEDMSRTVPFDPAGDHRLDRIRKPDPNKCFGRGRNACLSLRSHHGLPGVADGQTAAEEPAYRRGGRFRVRGVMAHLRTKARPTERLPRIQGQSPP